MRDRDDAFIRENLLRDPRRDPTDPPPAVALSEKPQDPITLGRISKRPQKHQESPSTQTTPQDASSTPNPEQSPPSSRRRPQHEPARKSESSSTITAVDPRIVELEPLVAAGDWEGVLKVLGSTKDVGKLPPNLGVVYAIAQKESGADLNPSQEESENPNVIAIRCTAGVFGFPAESPIAVMLGKRLIRSNPVAWQKKKAPPAPISLLIIGIGLAVGATIGWLVSFGYVRFHFPFFQ